MLRILCIFFFASICCLAQVSVNNGKTTDLQLRERPLEISGTPTPTQQWIRSVFGAIECDASGDVYFRTNEPGDSPFKAPVIKLNANGEVTRFGLSSVTGLSQAAELFAYSVAPDGRVFELVQDTQDNAQPIYMVSFSSAGEFTSKTLMEIDFRPISIVALPDRNFLVTGVPWKADAGEKSITVIATPDGSIQRRLRTTDVAGKGARAKGVADVPEVEFGDARLGDDGHVYVLRAGRAPTVYVFNGSGEPARTLHLTAPSADVESTSFLVSAGVLLVEYQSRTPVKIDGKDQIRIVYAAYNSQTGELNAAYSRDFKGIPACLTDRRMTILAPWQGSRFAIAHADLR